MPQQLKKILDSALTEIRGKRSLQYGLLAMALLFCGEMLLQWSDWQEAQEKQWQQLRSELRTLRNQSRDEATLRNQLNALEKQQMLVDERLWRVSSEAVGQARLTEYATDDASHPPPGTGQDPGDRTLRTASQPHLRLHPLNP